MSTNGRKPAPILNLDDLTEPGADWTYHGVTYQYVRWSGLGLLDRKRIDNHKKRLDELDDIVEPTEADAAEYELRVRELIGIITIDIPAEIVDGMEPEDRDTVAVTFFAVRVLRIADLKEKRIAAGATWLTQIMPSTPETSSPASIASGPKPTRRSGSRSRTPSSKRTSAP